MKSFFANLRALTLPLGASPTDPRIVLDGVNGSISIYGAGGVLLMTLDPNGFIVYDATGNQRTKIGIPALFSTIALGTGDVSETNRPVIDSQAGADYSALQFQSGNMGQGILVLSLIAPELVGGRPFFQFETGFLTGGLQPLVDLCGDVGGGNNLRVVLDDLWFGIGQGNANAPLQTRRIGQGLVPGSTTGTLTSNVTGSATNGTVVDIVALLGVPVRNGFKYRIEARGYTGITSGNLSATSQWEIDVDVDDGGGRTDIAGFKFNANNTIDVRVGIPAIVGEFTATADGTIDIRATIVKVGGTAAATFQTQNDATHPFTIRCYHVG